MIVEEMKSPREWDAFVEASSKGTFYHTIKWRKVIQKSFPYSSLYLAIRGANGTLVGICPGFMLSSTHFKVYNSLPHSDYGGPVIAECYSPQAYLSLRVSLERFCFDKDIAYAKILFEDNELLRSFNSPRCHVDTSGGTMEIDLKITPAEFIWNRIFSRNTRKKIRLIERDGFHAQEASTKSDLREFYNLYYKNMKYIGFSPYPYDFVENMWSILYPENFRIWLLGKNKRIGGTAVLKHRQKTYWVFVGIDREGCTSRYSVVPYLVWKEIQTAEEEGRTCVSLGSTPSDKSHPNYLQKKGFGALFCQQKMLWYPFTCSGHILIRNRIKAVRAWKAVQNFMPRSLRRTLENRLQRL